MRLFRLTLSVLAAVVLFWSFPVSPAQSGGVNAWISALKENLNDVNALKNIGIYCFDCGKTGIAYKCWNRVHQLQDSDPQAWYYLGRLLEMKNSKSQALSFYGRYGEAGKSSNYRGLLEGRYRLLSREMAKEEMQALLEQENRLGEQPPAPNTVAVFPFEARGASAKLSPLGKGLAEMMMTDLSQIGSLKVVERLRVQALMDEIKLGQTGLVEEESAQSFGKMLKAGKMVYGGFTLENKNRLAFIVTFADAVQNTSSESMEFKDTVANLFLVEKDAVFRVIDEMGISLTPQEKERIQRLPTKNLLAFVNYCMGLEMEDKGEFGKASQFYQKSLQLDPDYQTAGEKLQASQAVISAQTEAVPSPSPDGSSKEGRAAKTSKPMRRAETQTAAAGNQDLIRHRMDMMNQNMGSHFIPSTDTRNSPLIDAVRESSSYYMWDKIGNIYFGDNPLLHLDQQDRYQTP
jgi:TolB-like protein